MEAKSGHCEVTEECCEVEKDCSPEDCPVLTAISVIGGKWKIPILYLIRNEAMRFSALQRELTGITQKMLTQHLRELEDDGLVNRKVYAQVPPKVEYSVTPLAKKLEPILCDLCEWGTEYKETVPSKKNNGQPRPPAVNSVRTNTA